MAGVVALGAGGLGGLGSLGQLANGPGPVAGDLGPGSSPEGENEEGDLTGVEAVSSPAAEAAPSVSGAVPPAPAAPGAPSTRGAPVVAPGPAPVDEERPVASPSPAPLPGGSAPPAGAEGGGGGAAEPLAGVEEPVRRIGDSVPDPVRPVTQDVIDVLLGPRTGGP